MLTLSQQRGVVLLHEQLQNIPPSHPDPLSRHRDEAEDELLQLVIWLEPGKFLGIFTDQVTVKVGIDRRHYHKGGVLR